MTHYNNRNDAGRIVSDNIQRGAYPNNGAYGNYQGGYQQNYQQQDYRQQDNEPQKYSKYDMKKTAISMSGYAILCGVIIFAISAVTNALVDQLVFKVVGESIETSLVVSVVCAAIIALVGILSAFVKDTANEKTFNYAIIAMTAAISAFIVTSGVDSNTPWNLIAPFLVCVATGASCIYASSRLVENEDRDNRDMSRSYK